ncbi:MAG: LAGLIDADG family homing endonuclease [bacterium]
MKNYSISPEEAAAELLRRRRSRNSLLDFTKHIEVPGKPVSDDDDEWLFTPVETGIADHHLMILSVMQRVIDGSLPRAMFFLPPGSAKALALDTPIPTPTGWRRMGDLKMGDRVFGEDGKPCNVTWVSPVWRDRPCYAVKTDCGDAIIADHDHEWQVRLCGKPRKPLKEQRDNRGRRGFSDRENPLTQFKIKETHELCRRRAKRPMILRAAALELPETPLPIEPYLLGVWLGDGNSAGMRISSSVDDKKWLRGELSRLGHVTSDSSSATLFGVLHVRGGFAKAGLLNDPAHNTFGRKHIPDCYLRASIKQRTALLQGLIDTDGTINKERGYATFCNTNKGLSFQVRELVRSLGVKAGWSETRAVVGGKDCGPAYKVSFYLKDAARMPRKARYARDQQRTPNTYIDVAEAGRHDTVCIEVDSPSRLFLCGESMTPTHNSTYGSVVSPAWAMGKFPGLKIILSSYGSDLARRHGRRARQIVKQPQYQAIFGTKLSSDTAAADEWALTNGSEYVACGILSGITGHRAHGIIIDDPIKGRQEADSETVRERTWSVYQEDLRTRLIPGGWEIVIQCMVGSTKVLMADHSEKELRGIKSGDNIASYCDGKIITAKVIRWENKGSDYCLTIKMKSGITVTANERHPFLVNRGGELQWIRLRDLVVGESVQRVIGGNGTESSVALNGATSLQVAGGIADPITIRQDGPKDIGQLPAMLSHDETPTLNTDTGSASKNTTPWYQNNMDDVPCVESYPERTSERIGVGSCASIIAMTPERSGDCCAMTATSLLDTEKQKECCVWQPNTYEIIPDYIEEIIPAGREDVFDIQVDGTENFIANGLISHNTRWHENDLSGRLLPEEYEGESGLIRCRDGRDWYVVCLPAQCDRHDDPIGRKVGDYLWPEWFVPGHFEPFQSQPRTWNALFQQRPQPEEGTFFQRAWFKRYRQGEQPRFLHIYGSSDYATGDNEGDYTDHAVLGVDETGDIWVLDWWHKQATTDVWIDTQLDLIKTWAPFCWFEEAGVIKKAIRPFQERRMQERGIYCRHEWIPPVADKPTRARGFQARAADGKVHVPEGEIGDLIIDQFIRFPTGAHDDAVDTMSTFCMALDQAHPAIVQTQRKPKLQSDARIDFIEEQLPADEYEMAAFHNQIENVRFWEGYARQHVYGETYSPHEGGRTYGDVDGR